MVQSLRSVGFAFLVGAQVGSARLLGARSLLRRGAETAADDLFPTCSLQEKQEYSQDNEGVTLYTDVQGDNKSDPQVVKLKKPYKYETPEVTPAQLAEAIKNKEKLVCVFYAPWCPHCQHFVLYGPGKEPSQAPLELLHQKWKKNTKLESVQLYRYNTESPGANPPPNPFKGINAIPTIIGVKSDGTTVEFKGKDPTKELESWAMEHLA